jgi:hypothetical protein
LSPINPTPIDCEKNRRGRYIVSITPKLPPFIFRFQLIYS